MRSHAPVKRSDALEICSAKNDDDDEGTNERERNAIDMTEIQKRVL